ncbi:hypothetical protein BDR26DRAFT_850912 [Obelidium mucronatum]|nr:hypothetical protein BDR26DRAFT_850912 [Obelidium mucronatum]
MAPSLADWMLMCRYFENLSYCLMQHKSVEFMADYKNQPASLRLIMCALACLSFNPPLPKSVWLDYYNRARKAIKREGHMATDQHIFSYLLLSHFTMATGHPMLAEPYFFKAIRLMLYLGYGRDPDDSNQLCDLNEVEKNGRRYTFWCLYYTSKIVQIAMSRPVMADLDSSKVKRCKKPDFSALGLKTRTSEISTICYLSSFLDIIHDTTQLYQTKPPKLVDDILDSTQFEVIRSRIMHLLSTLPTGLVLSQDNSSQFVEFTSTIKDRETVIDCFFTTLFYNVSICLLNRPILYLTKFLHHDSIHLSNCPENKTSIQNSLFEAVAAAQTVVGLSSWLVHQSDMGLDLEGGQFRQRLWKQHVFESFLLFESVVVLWFATTQTQRFWWEIPGIEAAVSVLGLDDRKRIRSQVLDVLRTLKDLEVGLSATVNPNVFHVQYGNMQNFITPMVSCIEKMVEEMEDSENSMAGAETLDMDFDREVEEIAIEMNVMSLTEVDPEVSEPYTRDPWVLLGLLGVEVKGLRWKAWYEEDWRSFWTRVSSQ